jgi:mRNA interferase MazF
MKAKIVLIHFPFTDLTDSKLRPALVLHESEYDVVVAFISSKIPGDLQDSDFMIAMDHPSFFFTGLKVSSVIKFDKIATVSKDLIEGEIGEITRDLANECTLLLHRLFIL